MATPPERSDRILRSTPSQPTNMWTDCVVFVQSPLPEHMSTARFRDFMNVTLRDNDLASEDEAPVTYCVAVERKGPWKMRVSSPEMAEKVMWLNGMIVNRQPLNMHRHHRYRGGPPRYASFEEFSQHHRRHQGSPLPPQQQHSTKRDSSNTSAVVNTSAVARLPHPSPSTRTERGNDKPYFQPQYSTTDQTLQTTVRELENYRDFNRLLQDQVSQLSGQLQAIREELHTLQQRGDSQQQQLDNQQNQLDETVEDITEFQSDFFTVSRSLSDQVNTLFATENRNKGAGNTTNQMPPQLKRKLKGHGKRQRRGKRNKKQHISEDEEISPTPSEPRQEADGNVASTRRQLRSSGTLDNPQHLRFFPDADSDEDAGTGTSADADVISSMPATR